MPACRPAPVAHLVRVLGPVQRERGRDQDRRVDARDQLRQLRSLGRPVGALHDPDEEVGREEGPEDHHLGDDEKQHPEQRRVHARGAVGRRRAVVLVLGVTGRDGAGLHQASTGSSEDSTCSTGLFVAFRTRSTSLSATQRERSRRQRGDHDVRDVEELDRVHRRVVGIRVADHARGDDPLLLERVEQVAQPVARGLDRVALAVVLRHDDDEAARALAGELLQPLHQLAAGDRLVGDHERHVERQPVARQVDHDVLDGQPGLALERLDQVALHPARGLRGQRGDDDLGDPVLGDRVLGRVERVAVADLAAALDALARA